MQYLNLKKLYVVAFQSKFILPELDDRTVPLWEGALIVQVFLFSLPLLKGNTDGTILTLDTDAFRRVTGLFFGVFFSCAFSPFTEGICFKTDDKKAIDHDCEKLRSTLPGICNEILTIQVSDTFSCLLSQGPPKMQSVIPPAVHSFKTLS